MRLIVDTLIAMMLAGVLAAVLLHYRHEQNMLVEVQLCHQSLAELHEQAMYRGALGEVETAGNGFPTQMSPIWFASGLPVNNLVPGRQPWIDIAPPGDNSHHPPDPVITRPDQAGFWYNPNRGIFRARVPHDVSEDASLKLYNRLNNAALRTLPRGETNRQPLAQSDPVLVHPSPMQTTEVTTSRRRNTLLDVDPDDAPDGAPAGSRR